MRCTKAFRLIPLLSGSDLPEPLASRVRQHIQMCERCHHEFQMYRLSLEKTKEWLQVETGDWDEAEWNRLIQRARTKNRERSFLTLWPFKKGWALTFMAATALLLSILVVHPSLLKNIGERTSASILEISSPEVLSLKIVSKETGLKINWFFHKDLKLEVMK